MRETQIEKDKAERVEGHWREESPTKTLPRWEPKIGEVLVGELSARGSGCWSGIDFGETILIRTKPHVDVPLTVTGKELVHALRAIKPQIGCLLRFERLKDGDGPFPVRIAVERLELPEDDRSIVPEDDPLRRADEAA